MGRVFRVKPKRIYRQNGTVLTPEMEVVVKKKKKTLGMCSTPFYNQATELKEQYMRQYGFDLKKSGLMPKDFIIEKLD